MAKKVSRRLIASVVADRLVAGAADSETVMRELAAYLVAHNLVENADSIMNDIAEALFERDGHLAVEVTSAHPLTQEARKQLHAFLQTTTKATAVDMHETVRADLVGGFTARTATHELDASIRRQLQQLRAIA